jgi:ring-1,2-phenylacetyl-CoA epoxidase subunit PaaD
MPDAIDDQKARIREILHDVKDPEIPAISLIELGVLRDIDLENDSVKIRITPTYSGCPAMKVMEEDIKKKLEEEGYQDVEVEEVLSPAWSTDDITEEGRRKLKEYGIAPPDEATEDKNSLLPGSKTEIQCPQCGSRNTRLINQFGSTACKALHQCEDCGEAFDYFKCLR